MIAAMIAGTPIHWTDTSTWPWIVYVWLAMLVVGWITPLWRWLQKQRAQSWPTADGRIVSANVTPKTSRFLGLAVYPSNRPSAYMAELAYSYRVEGETHSGLWQKEFGGEDDAREFVRGSEGRPVIAAYNPRKPANSSLREDTVTALQNLLPPAAERRESPETQVPSWVKPLLWPFVLLSAIGLGLSLWVHIGAVMGRKVAPEPFFWMLHVGIFVVWFPAVFIANRRVGNTHRKDFWKAVLRGSPDWLRYLVYAAFAYAAVNFFLTFGRAPSHSTIGDTPVATWRGFSGHWMLFYLAALAILYFAAHAPSESTVGPPRAMKP